MKDAASGQTYWWNQTTNEVTALGQPKPGDTAVGQPAAEQGGGLGAMVAQGFAFGVGSSIARMGVGALFGGDEGGGEDMGGGETPASSGNEWGDEDEL